MLKKLNNIKSLVFALGLQLHAQSQSSILIPIGASMTVPDNAYVCAETITVNGILISSGVNVCGLTGPDAIASILEASALNENGYYKIGDEISITIKYNKNVLVTGTPEITLRTGANDQVARYSSGSESIILTFNYIVQKEDLTSRLEYVSSSALSLNGGSIKDLQGKDADIVLPEPGSENSLSSNKDIYIDGIIPTVGNVIDGFGENDLDFSSSLSELSFNWIGFNDNTSSGIKKFMIGIGSSPGETNVQSYIDVGINRNHTFSNLDLYNGSTYYGIVKVEDKAGNSAAAVSNGVTIDQFPGAPQVVGYFYPGEDYQLPNNYSSELSIEFSEPINDIVISISSSLGSMAFDTTWQESKTKLVYSFTSPIPSFSQLDVSLTNITDFAGIKGDNFAITYNTAALGDYNFDSSVDGLDLANFISSWNNNDLSYELGPAIGTVPNLIVTPDGRFDLEDIMGFTRMWHWSRKNAILGKILSELGQRLIYDLDGQNLKFDWIEGASVGQFDFEYDPTMLTLKRLNESKDNNYKLSYVDTLRGYNSFAFVNSNPSQFLSPAFSFDISSRESKSINLNYQFYDDFGSLMAQGSELITLKPIPSEFALHSNYPNPFNPATTINYDLPNDALIDIMIYDILGREVKSLHRGLKQAGYHSVIWDSKDNQGGPVSAGIYFYQIRSKEFVKTKKMILLK